LTPQISLTQSLNTPQAATFQLDGLQPVTTYHYQAVAENSAGIGFGGDVTFTTPLVTAPLIAQVAYQSIAVPIHRRGPATGDHQPGQCPSHLQS
jgi:hypothetical protein